MSFLHFPCHPSTQELLARRLEIRVVTRENDDWHRGKRWLWNFGAFYSGSQFVLSAIMRRGLLAHEMQRPALSLDEATRPWHEDLLQTEV